MPVSSMHYVLAALARFTHSFSRFDRTLSSSLLLMIMLEIPFSATTDLDSTGVDATHPVKSLGFSLVFTWFKLAQTGSAHMATVLARGGVVWSVSVVLALSKPFLAKQFTQPLPGVFPVCSPVSPLTLLYALW